MRYPTILIAALISLTLTACSEPQDTRPGQPVDHRRAAFKKILLAFEPMGIQLREKQYKADRFIVQAKELAKLKDGPWQYFGTDTNYPPTHATAKVWSEADHFEADRQAFLQAIDRLVLAAESGEEKQVATAYEAVHDSCRKCHKTFKQ
ncbi:c-type cytochrome [Propionivibrio sp.]|uniref:c-type cytochrome n=1 Tax=Propionivibrio sp. TaxID=2212460 RepID=UPI003BF1E327